MLKKLTVDQFDQIHHIMEQSFPRDERRPREEQLALFEKENYHVFGMTDQNGCVIALIAVWDLQTVVFVEHFAVSPDHRNGGLGSRLLQDLIHTLEVPLCLEVELPETEMARRRIGFYERNGFFYNDYPYMQPPLSKGQACVPLRIMTTSSPLSAERFKELKKLLHARIYDYEEQGEKT